MFIESSGDSSPAKRGYSRQVLDKIERNLFNELFLLVILQFDIRLLKENFYPLQNFLRTSFSGISHAVLRVVQNFFNVGFGLLRGRIDGNIAPALGNFILEGRNYIVNVFETFALAVD